MNKSDSAKITEGLSKNVKMPEFLPTLDKWNEVVLSIDSVKKFDDLALKLLEDDEVDVFQFHDILLKLAEDVRILRPNDGEIITFIADTITDMLEFLGRYQLKSTCKIMSPFCLCWRCTRAGMLSDPDVVLLHWTFWVQGDLILIYYWAGLRSAAPTGGSPCSAVLRHLRAANALVHV